MLLAREQAANIAPVQDDDRERGPGGEGDHRPRGAVEKRPQRQRDRREDRRHRGIARQEEDEDPDTGRGESRQRRDGERDAARRRHDLPPTGEAEEKRAPVADHGSDTGEDADQVTSEPEPEDGGGRALGDVQQRDGHPELEAERPPDVRRPGVAAPERPDVDTAQQPREPVPPRHAAEDVARGDEERVGSLMTE